MDTNQLTTRFNLSTHTHPSPQSDLPGGAFPAEITIRTSDIYADTPEAKEEVARSVRTQDLILSARLDKGA